MYSAATLLDVLDLDTPLIGFHLGGLDKAPTGVAGYVDASHSMDFESSLLLCAINNDYEASGETYCDDTILDFDTDADSYEGPEPSLETVIDFYRRYTYTETDLNGYDALKFPSFELSATFVEPSPSSSGKNTPDSSLPNTPADVMILLPEEGCNLGPKSWQFDTLVDRLPLDYINSNYEQNAIFGFRHALSVGA